MKLKRLLFLFALCTLILASCASSSYAAVPTMAAVDSSKGYDSSYSTTNQVNAPMTELALSDAAGSAPASGGYTDATSVESSDQMVVKNASLNMLVDDPSKTLDDIMKLADDLGGYTVTSNKYQSYSSYDTTGLQYTSASVTIRVPAEKLTDAMTAIKNMTGDPDKYVTNESVSGEDVTQAYTDLQSRLRNLEEAEAELTKMYEKAEKAEDVLAIYNQKMQVSEQIEVLKGQIQYYEDASATSSIAIQIDAKASVQPITVAGWEPKGIARDAVQALVNFFKGLVNFLIWFIILVIPVLAVIGLPIYFFVRWLVRRSRAKKAARNVIPPMPTEK